MSKMDEPDLEPKWAGRKSDHPTHCPSCNADFKGDEIDKKYRAMYPGMRNFSRVIWISSMKRDAGVAYRCPDCNHEWAIPGREDWFKEHVEGGGQ